LRWFLLLKNGVTFEDLLGKKQKNVDTVADTLSRIDIDSLKIQEIQEIQEENELTIFSGSKNSSISNIK
jgi:hypothetical protein